MVVKYRWKCVNLLRFAMNSLYFCKKSFYFIEKKTPVRERSKVGLNFMEIFFCQLGKNTAIRRVAVRRHLSASWELN